MVTDTIEQVIGIYRWDNVPHHPSVYIPYRHHMHEAITESPPMDMVIIFHGINEKIQE